MNVARAFVFASLAVGAVAWSACVGDEPATQAASDAGGPGSLDQACFGNGTCNAGLSCVSNVCVDLDSGGADDSSVDGSKQGIDAGSVCDAGPQYTNGGKIPCPAPEAVCDPGTAECCAQTTGTSCPSPGTSCDMSTGANIGCVLPSHCDTATSVCCISAPTLADFVDNTCPRTAVINEGLCQTSCPTGKRQACVTNADCPEGRGMTCQPFQTTYNKNSLAAPLVIGLCVTN